MRSTIELLSEDPVVTELCEDGWSENEWLIEWTDTEELSLCLTERLLERDTEGLLDCGEGEALISEELWWLGWMRLILVSSWR